MNFPHEAQTLRNQVLHSNQDSWILFSLFNNSAKLYDQGVGLDSLSCQFQDGYIMFAFLRLLEPISNLAKFVLITWCGEGFYF